jgi:hypothetical protein
MTTVAICTALACDRKRAETFSIIWLIEDDRTAQIISAAQTRNANGLRFHATRKSPVQIAPIARVPPQPGQGSPVKSRTGQIIGPLLKPLVRNEASRMIMNPKSSAAIRTFLVPNTVVVKLLLETYPERIPEFIPKWCEH